MNSAWKVLPISNPLATELYGLEAVAEAVEDHTGNQTRFLLLAREGVPAPTGHDKTSVVVFQRANEPGSLLAILNEFAARNIDLSRLESRPTRRVLGDYCFLLDFEGHIGDEVVADCLRDLKMKQGDIKFLGPTRPPDTKVNKCEETATLTGATPQVG